MEQQSNQQFDAYIKKVLENYDIPYKQTDWEHLSEQMDKALNDNFDQHIANTLNNQVFPYQNSDWELLSEQMDDALNNTFDQHIANTLNNQTFPYQNDDWELLSEQMDEALDDSFDQHIATTLKNHTPPYQNSDWDKMTTVLDKDAAQTLFLGFSKPVYRYVAAALLAIAFLYGVQKIVEQSTATFPATEIATINDNKISERLIAQASPIKKTHEFSQPQLKTHTTLPPIQKQSLTQEKNVSTGEKELTTRTLTSSTSAVSSANQPIDLASKNLSYNNDLSAKLKGNSKLKTQNSKPQTQNHKLTTTNHKLTTHNSKLTTTNHKLTTHNSQLTTTNHKLTTQNSQTTNSKPQTTNSKPQTQNSQLTTTNHKLTTQNSQTTNSKPQTTNSKPQTQNSQLTTTNHKLTTQNSQTTNSKPQTTNSKPQTQNAKIKTLPIRPLDLSITPTQETLDFKEYNKSKLLPLIQNEEVTSTLKTVKETRTSKSIAKLSARPTSSLGLPAVTPEALPLKKSVTFSPSTIINNISEQSVQDEQMSKNQTLVNSSKLYPKSLVSLKNELGQQSYTDKLTKRYKPIKPLSFSPQNIVLGIHTTVEINSLNLMHTLRPGTTTGLSVEWRANDQWSLETGGYYTRKRFQTNLEHVLSFVDISNTIRQQERLFADMELIEVPLLVKYRFSTLKSITPYISAGLSAYIPIRDKHKYENSAAMTSPETVLIKSFTADGMLPPPTNSEYTSTVMFGNYDYQYTEQNTSRSYWDIVNLRVGVNYPLSNRLNIGLESQFKTSLLGHKFKHNAITSKRIYSLGLQLGVTCSL